MRRVAGTEIPTYVWSEPEWNARRAAGHLALLEACKGMPPSLEELGKSMGLRSKATVFRHVQRAADMGLIYVDPVRNRRRRYSCRPDLLRMAG